MSVLLGIDLGTSSVRSMALTSELGRTEVFGESYDISFPHIYWAEQNPLVWYEKTCITIQKLISSSGLKPEEICGIGFSGQMHGLVCLDENKELVRPAIIWQDQRSASSIQKIYNKLGDSFVASQNQNTIAPGFLLASLYWLFEHEPDTYKRIKYVMLPKDYIKFRLTGRIVTDYSDAAGSAAFDNINLCWAVKLLDILGLRADIFPEHLPSEEVIGNITEKAAAETGLKKGTPVINGGADQCMQAIGNGIISDGVFACNIGTGGQVSTSVSKPFYDTKLRVSTFAHAIPQKWNIMAAILNAGASLKWLAKQVLGTTDYSRIDTDAEKVPPGCEGLIFMPYLTGERILKDPDARGIFFGIVGKHDRSYMARAVMEGVVFVLRYCFDIITNDMGIPCKKIIAAGGGAAGNLWPQIQADILEQPIIRSLNMEQACLGAAICAGIGTGVYTDAITASKSLVKYDDKVYEPRKEYQSLYREYYAMFQDIYIRNKDVFKKITSLSAGV